MNSFNGLPLSIKVVIVTLLSLLAPVVASYGIIITPEQIELIAGGIVTIGVVMYSVLKTKKVMEKKIDTEIVKVEEKIETEIAKIDDKIETEIVKNSDNTIK